MISLPRGITAIVGGGGKSTLQLFLGRAYSVNARVILCTTTHFWPPDCTLLINPDCAAVEGALAESNLVAVGSLQPDGKLTASALSPAELSSLADYVIVEADGARGRPLKAPAAHEPVIPADAALVIAVAGMDGVGRPISEAAHRPELYAAAVGKSVSDAVTAEDAAAVLTSQQGQRKNVECDFAVVLNKADDGERLALARRTAELLDCDFYITALKEGRVIERRRCDKCLQ